MTLTDTTTPGQSEPESNFNEEIIPYLSEIQNRSLTTECSLVSYTWYFMANSNKNRIAKKKMIQLLYGLFKQCQLMKIS